MSRTFRTEGNVSTAADYRADQITVYRATVEVFTPAPATDDMPAGSFVRYESCEHYHLTPAAAQRCADGMASRIRQIGGLR